MVLFKEQSLQKSTEKISENVGIGLIDSYFSIINGDIVKEQMNSIETLSMSILWVVGGGTYFTRQMDLFSQLITHATGLLSKK